MISLPGSGTQYNSLMTTLAGLLKAALYRMNSNNINTIMAKTIILSITLLMTLFTAGTCQQEIACSNVQEKLQALSEAVQLCGSTTPAPISQCNCNYSATWTSVPLTTIGTSNLQHAGTLAYTIPRVIPSTAREVLVLASIYCGYTPTIYQHIKIYTQQGTNHYEKYLFMFSHAQDAINTNSDNMWFPMTTNRRIYMEIPSAHGGHCGGLLKAIGYRWTPDPSSSATHG